LGAVAAKTLGPADSALPNHIHVPSGRGDAAFLGPQFAALTLEAGALPQDLVRPATLSEAADLRRHALRESINRRFVQRRRTAESDAFAHSFDQALSLMGQREIFDLASESETARERYGKSEFGQHLLLARRLIENGVTFVQVKHTNYDTHFENFDFHIEQLGEFDQAFAALIQDLVERGLWQSTLVIVMSEFGRTPRINHFCGRDHWAKAWSVALGGCGIQPGALYGKTDPTGNEVVDKEVNQAHLFHTYLRAVGLDSSGKFDVAGRQIPMADPAAAPIRELLL
jgi:hypothetical protein